MIQGPLTEMLIDGRYRVGELIGSGGFGHVYAAIHVGLEGKVAIKVPRIDDVPPGAISEAIGNFLEEGRMLRRLRHPNLAAALDVALLPPDAEGIALPYLVLEWCDGPTLKEWLAQRPGPIGATEAWLLLKPVFEAIAHAHAEGIAHRDIKPANIIMEELRDGSVAPRVIDFGIAKIVAVVETPSSGSTRTTSARRAFTPRYASPEQLTGMRTGPRTDVYALALVLLETILGRPVFASDSDSRRAVLESNPPTPRKLGVDLDGWNEVFERALAPKATDRYADAGAFLRALEGAPEPLDDLPPLPGPPGFGPPPPPAEGALDDSSAPPDAAEISSNATGPIAPPPRTAPGDGTESGARSLPQAPPDPSVAPASHTLRGDATGPALRPTSRLGLLVAAAAAVALGATAALVWWGGKAMDGVTPAGSGSVAAQPPGSVVAAPGTSSISPGSLKPLRSLTGADLVDRATRAGLTGCNVSVDTAESVIVLCGVSQLRLDDDGRARPPGGLRDRAQAQAAALATGGNAVRFTTQGTWTLYLVADPSHADRAMKEILVGIGNEGIGTEVPPQVPATAIPARLADWKGPELPARVRAIGGKVISDDAFMDQRTILFAFEGTSGMLIFHEDDPTAAITFIAAGDPYAMARDGRVSVSVLGPPAVCDVKFLKKLLGDTTAEKFSRRP